MKELTQSEFEEQIRRLINGEISLKKLAKELKTDIHNLERKIILLEKSNPQLYKEYVEKFPYKPKKIKINIETLAIYILKNGLQQTILDTGISKMTISRRIKELKEINPELYDLYTSRNSRMTDEEREYFEFRIGKFTDNNIELVRTELEDRKKNLENQLNEFEILLKQGLSKDDAARRLGYKDYTPIWKKYKELERINTEKRVSRTNVEDSRDYRNSMRVEGIKPVSSGNNSTGINYIKNDKKEPKTHGEI